MLAGEFAGVLDGYWPAPGNGYKRPGNGPIDLFLAVSFLRGKPARRCFCRRYLAEFRLTPPLLHFKRQKLAPGFSVAR